MVDILPGQYYYMFIDTKNPNNPEKGGLTYVDCTL
jgi:hypothetical protein